MKTTKHIVHQIVGLALCATVITGCSAATSSEQIEAASRLCEANDGLKAVYPHFVFLRHYDAECNNGAYFSNENVEG